MKNRGSFYRITPLCLLPNPSSEVNNYFLPASKLNAESKPKTSNQLKKLRGYPGSDEPATACCHHRCEGRLDDDTDRLEGLVSWRCQGVPENAQYPVRKVQWIPFRIGTDVAEEHQATVEYYTR